MKTEIRNFSWVAGPKILAGGLQFGLVLVLLRFFNPAQFGVLSVCMAAVLLGDSVMGGATDSGVLRLAPLHNVEAPTRSLQYQQAGLILKLLLAFVMAAPALLFARPVSVILFQNESGAPYLIVSFAALVGMLALRSVQMHFQVNSRFTPYGASDLASSLLKFGGIALLLLTAPSTPIMVLVLYAAAPLLVTLGILSFSGRPLLTVPFSGSVLSELFSFVKWYLATAAIGTLIARMDVFLVSSLAGVGEAGIFSAAQAIAVVPQLIGSYIAVVFSPKIMPMWEAGTLKALYKKFQIAIMLCALSSLVIGLALIPKLAPVLFPKSFHAAGGVILLLLPAGLCALVNFPLTMLLLLFSKPKFLFGLDLISLPFLVLIYAWVIPAHGAAGAAIVTTGAAVVKMAIMQVVAWQTLQKPLSQPAPAPESLAIFDEVTHADR